VPALGHAPAGQLHLPLIERRLELQEEQSLFNVEDPGHDSRTLAARASIGLSSETLKQLNLN
jgi:hypothetical protein